MNKKQDQLGATFFLVLFIIFGLGLLAGSFHHHIKTTEASASEPYVYVEEKVVVKDIIISANVEGYSFFTKTKDYDLLIKLVYSEARGESLEGQKEVVRVVFNRVKSEHFPNTIQEVIMQPGQFCPAGDLEDLVMIEDYLGEIEYAILSVYSEYVLEDYKPEEMALFFVNPRHAAPRAYAWMNRSLTYLRTVGNHEFYQ